MKRRAPQPLVDDDQVPPEFRVGRVVEVWAQHTLTTTGRPSTARPSTVAGRYLRAWRCYVAEVGLDPEEARRLYRPGLTYSVGYLIDRGRQREVDERLSAAGVDLADVPALRARAERWIAAAEGHRDHDRPTRHLSSGVPVH